MNFTDPLLEKIYKSFKWARNNTIQIFNTAQENNILSYQSTSAHITKHTFQPLLFQFQCIATTTDAYIRKITKHTNQNFGILMQGKKTIHKKDISPEELHRIFRNQLITLEHLFSSYDPTHTLENINFILAILNHEYLHQGQMIGAASEGLERFVKD